MATQTWTYTQDLSVVANYRTWAAAFESALAAVGLVYVPQTGDADWTTQSLPGSLNYDTSPWSVFRTDDAFDDVFIKIFYARNGTQVWLGLAIGTAVNGSGVLTNEKRMPSANYTQPSSTTDSVGNATDHLCGDAGGFVWVHKPGSAFSSAPSVWSIERSCDESGAPTADSMSFHYCGQDSKSSYFMPNGVAIASPVEVKWAGFWFQGGADKGNYAMGLVATRAADGGLGNPSRYLGLFYTSDLANQQDVEVLHYGTNVWFRSLKPANAANGWNPPIPNNPIYVLYRWE